MNDHLLDRIAGDPAIAAYLAWPGDFVVDRDREPVEPVVLPTGAHLEVIGGCGAGGSYFLVGPEGSPDRPVLYADSEGGATLLAEDLAEAVTLIACLPYWRDAGHGHPLADLDEELREMHPEFEADRDRTLAALGLAPVPQEEALARLRATAARTAPGHLPFVPDDDHLPYEPLFGDPGE
ncbi:hypothetical protein [Streptomyces sp. NPDC093225]|uniref:hypothetical protein n=1 Tax=Streptomyces sp. NPDC093225 TaxID=3366034 RepID=UPI00381AC17A